MALRKRGKWWYGDSQADIRSEIVRYSKGVGYRAEHFADAVCGQCGGRVFALYLDGTAGVASRVCAGCDAEVHPIGDSADFMDESEEEECACPCGEERFEITVGVSLYDDSEDVKWLYVGCRCPKCGLTAVYGDWKNEFIGYRELLARVQVVAPNQALQQTAAAMLASRSSTALGAAAAAEPGRSAPEGAPMGGRFTPAVLRVLRKAGWADGRRVDTAATEALLREWGLLLPAALAIIREFDGLKCEATDTGSWLDFDVPEALMWFEPWQAPALPWVTGQPVCPVGHGNGCVWLIAESGEVVSLKDDWLGYTREPSFPYALDTHFRADYGRLTWVDIGDAELEQVFARLKPPEAEPGAAPGRGGIS